MIFIHQYHKSVATFMYEHEDLNEKVKTVIVVKYIKNLHDSTPGRQTVHLKNGQRT